MRAHRDQISEDTAGELRADLNALLMRRARLGLWIILAVNLVIVVADLHRAPSRPVPPLLTLVAFALIGLGFALFRWSWIAQRATSFVMLGAAMTCIVIPIGNIVRGEFAATGLLIVLVALGTCSLFPWGVLQQLVTVVAAGLALAVNVYVVTGGLDVLLDYPAAVTLAGLAASVGVTYELHRHRLRLLQENIDRRRAEERVTRLNEELEQRVAERTAQLNTTNEEFRREIQERHAASDALRESQKRLQDIIDNTTAVIYVKDVSGRYLLINLRYEVLFHVTRAEVVGKTDYDLFPPEAAAVFQDNDRAVVEANESIHFEEIVPHDDGLHTYISVKFPLYDSAGLISAVCGISTDITARKQAEEAARQHQSDLTHVLRVSTVGEIATSLAHEINQPLGAIANYAAGCARRIRAGAAAPVDVLPAIDRIAEQAQRAGEVVRHLRELVRKDTQRNDAIDLNEVVQAAVRVMEPQARQESISIHYEPCPQLRAVRADAIQIEQVVLNILLNAVEAMRTTPERHRVVTVRVSAEVDSVEVTVRDAGAGFTPAIADRAFDPFFTTKANGMGMGLAISRSIVEAHGGRLWATPNSDRGSTFRFTLPCPDSERPSQGAAS